MMDIKNVRAEQRFAADKLQKVNLFATANFFTDLYCLEPGQEQKIHAHKGADKIYFVLDGTARIHLSGEEADVSAGQMVLAPADLVHGVRNESKERVVVLVFMAPNPNQSG